MDLSDLEVREERADLRQSVKKPIQLKIKSSSNLIFASNSSNSTSVLTETDDKNLISIGSNFDWSFGVNKIGQKISDQKMNVCISCSLPILIFGRLLPCKHVICFDCASKISPKYCLKDTCGENVDRIEKVNAGRIFLCSYESNNKLMDNQNENQLHLYEKSRCGRSYMSQRDLDAHINHRHLPNVTME